MKRTLVMVVAAMVLVIAASASAASTSSGTRSADELKFGYDGVAQLNYGNTLLAWKLMRDPQVAPMFFQTGALNQQALASGQVQLSQSSATVVLPAIAKGAKLKVIGASVVGSWVLMVSSDIKKLSDLKGKKLAAHSQTSVSAFYAQRACKIAGCTVVYIPGSPVRAQALLSGEISATTVFLADALQTEATNPGKTRVLAYYRNVPLPDLYVVTTADWLQDHQAEAANVLYGILKAVRLMKSNPAAAVKALAPAFPDTDPKLLQSVVTAYVKGKNWSPDLGYEAVRTVTKTVDFLKSTGSISASAPRYAGAYVDIRPLKIALARLAKEDKAAAKKKAAKTSGKG